MKMKKVLVAALALLALAVGTAQAEMYVEGYLGGNIVATSPQPLELSVNPLFAQPANVDLQYPSTAQISFMGGLKVGTWFVKEGFLGFNYPNWMKYLGFYLDFSFHKLNIQRSIGSQKMFVTFVNRPSGFQYYKFFSQGNLVTVAFMFTFRYGFRPDEIAPFGRLQPYVAVGPAIFISTIRPTIRFFPGRPDLPIGNIHLFSNGYYGLSQTTSVNVGLALEFGLRWMLLKNVSMDSSIKYRYVQTNYNLDFVANGFSHKLKVDPAYHLVSFHVGVAYHF